MFSKPLLFWCFFHSNLAEREIAYLIELEYLEDAVRKIKWITGRYYKN